MQIIDNLLGKASQQANLHSGEVFQLWQHLVHRYDIIELTDIFQNFAKDTDFKVLLSQGLLTLQEEVVKIEDKMNQF